jgi:hypothetical protein
VKINVSKSSSVQAQDTSNPSRLSPCDYKLFFRNIVCFFSNALYPFVCSLYINTLQNIDDYRLQIDLFLKLPVKRYLTMNRYIGVDSYRKEEISYSLQLYIYISVSQYPPPQYIVKVSIYSQQ